MKLLSSNTKCDVSINFPIEATCNPTETCRKLCYARRGPITWPASIARQKRIYNYFLTHDYIEIGEQILEETKNREWLRWCGSGDIFPEAISVINFVAHCRPEMKNWIVTRKPEEVSYISQNQNIYLMFSLDGTSKEKIEKLAKERNHKRLYFSYLRVDPEENTRGSSIIFNAKQIKTLPYDDKRRVCPADSGQMKVAGACAKCQRCFSPRVLEEVLDASDVLKDW